MIRGRRAVRRGASNQAELAFLESYLSNNLFSWIRADYVTLAGAKTSAWNDKVADGVGARAIDPGHMFSQGTDAARSAAPVILANLNNNPAVQGDRAAAAKYPSTLSAANWAWTNQAAGTAIYVVHVTPSSFAVGGNQWCVTTISSVGMDFFFTTSAQVQFRVVTATGTASRAISSLSTSTPAIARLKHATSLSPDSSLAYTGKTTNTGDYTTGTPTGNPDTTMYVMGASFGSTYAGYLAEVLFANNVSAAFETLVSRYFQLRYGLT